MTATISEWYVCPVMEAELYNPRSLQSMCSSFFYVPNAQSGEWREEDALLLVGIQFLYTVCSGHFLFWMNSKLL